VLSQSELQRDETPTFANHVEVIAVLCCEPVCLSCADISLLLQHSLVVDRI